MREQPIGEAVEDDERSKVIAYHRGDTNAAIDTLLEDIRHLRRQLALAEGAMIAIGVQADIAEKSSITEALTKQREELGAKATERVNAVTTWLGAKIGGELAGALAPMLYTAKQVQAFEKLMLLNRGAVPGNPGGGRDGMGGSTQIEGYDKMNFRQRMAAIDRAKTGN